MKVIEEFILRTMLTEQIAIEKRIRLVVQNKPKWIPDAIWKRVIARVVGLEVTAL